MNLVFATSCKHEILTNITQTTPIGGVAVYLLTDK